jgi:hypothetical protein
MAIRDIAPLGPATERASGRRCWEESFSSGSTSMRQSRRWADKKAGVMQGKPTPAALSAAKAME